MLIKHPAQTIWTLLAILILISLIIFSNQLKHLISPTPTLSVKVDLSCHLRAGSCTSVLPTGGKLSFAINPPSIPVLQQLELQVVTEGIDVITIDVNLVGIGMDMGYNYTRLVKENGQPNHFKGNTTIPICIRNRMNWEAKVLLHTQQGIINVPFHFYTTR